MIALVTLLLLGADPSPELAGAPVTVPPNCRFWQLPDNGGNMVCVTRKGYPDLPEGRLQWEWHPGDPMKEQVENLEQLSEGKAEAEEPCRLNKKPATCRTLKVGTMVYRFAQWRKAKQGPAIVVRCEYRGEMPSFCAAFFQ